jgi:hypothetical protein
LHTQYVSKISISLIYDDSVLSQTEFNVNADKNGKNTKKDLLLPSSYKQKLPPMRSG